MLGPVTLQVNLAVEPIGTARDFKCEITSGGLIICRWRCHSKSRSRSVISFSLSSPVSSASASARCWRSSCKTSGTNGASSSTASQLMPSSSFGGISSRSESYASCSAFFRASSASASIRAFSSASLRAWWSVRLFCFVFFFYLIIFVSRRHLEVMSHAAEIISSSFLCDPFKVLRLIHNGCICVLSNNLCHVFCVSDTCRTCHMCVTRVVLFSLSCLK